jgi:hypothetical protein
MQSHLGWVAFGIPLLLFLAIIFLDSLFFEKSPSQKLNEKKLPEYCIWPGCKDTPSKFWADDTGYCKKHVQEALEINKLYEKNRKQGY